MEWAADAFAKYAPRYSSLATQRKVAMNYSEFVRRHFDRMGSPTMELLHAVVGISGEAGELLDAVKKHWVYGRELDRGNVIEELGDLEFYLEACRQAVGVSREFVLAANQTKLQKRYPSGSFTQAEAVARADKAREAA